MITRIRIYSKHRLKAKDLAENQERTPKFKGEPNKAHLERA